MVHNCGLSRRKEEVTSFKIGLALPPLVFMVDTHRMGLVERLELLIVPHGEIAQKKGVKEASAHRYGHDCQAAGTQQGNDMAPARAPARS